MVTDLADSLLSWYRLHKRDLPWRKRDDPYAIWVSEIMLQQTRVETVIPFFERWMERFPTLQVLSDAPLQDVLVLWEGLGYYQRAQNIHRSANVIVSEHGGVVPSDPEILMKLPGIGSYTAGAIASIAFSRDVPILDGNIRRVYSRVFDIAEPLRSSESENKLWQIAEACLPSGEAGQYNQALMDLGALICIPRNPRCQDCPIKRQCQAYNLGMQDLRPVRRSKSALPHHTVTAAILQKNGRILIAQRPPRGLLGGLWEFPGGKVKEGEDLASCLQREICEELGVDIEVGDSFGRYQHAYTHFRVTLYAFFCRLIRGQPQPLQVEAVRWVRPTELQDFPMGKIDRQIARKLSEMTKD